MQYDLPTVERQAGGMTPATAPESRDFSAEQNVRTGAAMVGAGATMSSIGREIQNDIDTAVTKEADIKLAESLQGLFYRDDGQGYLQLEGKNAVMAKAATLKAMQDSANEVEKTLTNDVQRYMFKTASSARLMAARGQLEGHAANQAKVYRRDTSLARAKASFDSAETNYKGFNDPSSQYSKDKALGLHELDEVATMALGYEKDSPLYKEFIKEHTTKLHTDIIGQMLVNDDVKNAQEYYKLNKPEIDSKYYKGIDDRVNDKVAYVDGKAEGSKVYLEFTKGLDVNHEPPVDKMISAIDGNSSLSDKGKEYAKAKVGDLYSKFSAEKRRAQEDASNLISGIMLNDKNLSQYSRVVSSINGLAGRVDNAALLRMKDAAESFYGVKEDRAIAKAEARLARKAQSALAAEDWLNQYLNGDFGKLTKSDVISKYTGELGENVFTIAKTVEKVNDSLANPKMTMADFDQKIKTMYAIPEYKKVLGFDPFSKDTSAIKKKLLLFDHVMESMGVSGEKGPGKQLTLDQAILSGIQKEKVSNRYWFGDTEYSDYEIAGLSEADKLEFVKGRLIKAGKPLTVKNINAALYLLNKTRTKRTTKARPMIEEE